MRQTLIMLTFAACVLLSSTVYGEGAKVPASTTAIEKAVLPTMSVPANTNGANIKIVPMHNFAEAFHIDDMLLAEIHWLGDETFYSIGYKAVLSKEKTEIFVPPAKLLSNCG